MAIIEKLETVEPKPISWVWGPMFSLVAGIGGIVWGWDYYYGSGRVIIDTALMTSHMWGAAFFVTGLPIVVLTLAQLWWARQHEVVPRVVLWGLMVAHFLGFVVCLWTSMALFIGIMEEDDEERVLFACLGAVINHVFRMTELPKDLVPPARTPAWLRRGR